MSTETSKTPMTDAAWTMMAPNGISLVERRFARELECKLATANETIDQLRIERDGALHSGECWELMFAQCHEEIEQAKAEIARLKETKRMDDAVVAMAAKEFREMREML